MPTLGGPILEAPSVIIFDIGRVIIRVNMARSLAILSKRDGLTHEQALRELESDERWSDWQEGRMTPQEWHVHVNQKFHLSLGFDEFCETWNSVLESRTILPNSLFERLAAKCRLGLLSNTDPIHVAHFEAAYSFVRHFPVRVYSCRVGATKPAPMIYHHALRELEAWPEEAMFIDDIRENAAAAAVIGMSGFHFTGPDDLLLEFSRLGL